MNKEQNLANLQPGQYAITNDGMPVLCVSRGSFLPKFAGLSMVVHIVNGIGAFPRKDKCRIVTMEEAFSVALAKAVTNG